MSLPFRSTVFAVLALAGILAAVGLLAYLPSTVVEGDGSGEEAKRLESIESRVDALSAQVGMLASELRSRQGQAFTGNTGSPSTGPRENPEPMDSAAAEVRRNRQLAEMNAAFEAEQIDPKWASIATQRLQAVGTTDAILAIEIPPPRHTQVQCRARTCRMKFSFPNSADATDWALAYVTGIGSALRQVRYEELPEPDGTTAVIMFGYR